MRLKRRSSSRRASNGSRRGDWQGGVGGGGGRDGGEGGGGRQVLGAKKGGGGRRRVEGVGWAATDWFWERKAGKCVKCAYRRRNSPPAASTPLRAGSASSIKNKMRGPAPPCGLSRARFLGGVKGGKKGGFTSDSSNTPLGRRTLNPYTPKP